MRIDLNLGNLEPVRSETTRRSGDTSAIDRKKTRQDEAVLSSNDSSIDKLTIAALAVPDVRTERVAQLRDSISNGTYSVQPGLVANAILHDLF